MVGSVQMPGLSGFDSGTLIDQLMEVEQQPLYDMADKKASLELKEELYAEMNLKVYDFQATMFDLTLESTFRKKNTTVSDDDIMSATASIEAQNGTFTFKNITLATSTIVASSDQINSSSILSSTGTVGGLDTSKSFEDAGFTELPQGTVTFNGVEFNLSYFSSVDSFMKAVEDNAAAGVQDFSYNGVTDTFSITADSGVGLSVFETKDYGDKGFFTAANIGFIDSSAKLNTLNSDISITSGIFTINGVDFNVNSEIDSIDNLITRINASDAGVTAYYDNVSEKFTLTAKNEGNTAIVLENGSSNFLDAMKVSTAVQNIGSNATFEFNGVATSRNSNEFEINGVTFDLKKADAGPVTVEIESDSEDITEKLEQFVEDYNEIMTDIYTKLNEETADDDELSLASDADELEALQKQGLLRRDTVLRDLQDRMKNFFATSFAGYTMEDIGIGSSGASGVVTTDMKIGLIEFDKEKFEEAVQDMPDIVEAMFRNDGETYNMKNYTVAVADGNKKTFSLGYRNIGQDVSINIGSTNYKMVTNPSAADEFSVDRESGMITFFEAPPANAEIVGTYSAYEGEDFSELEKNIGNGNGFRTTFSLGARHIGQNVSVVVGDGSTLYSQVESMDELTGDTYYVDRDSGKITFANAIAAGDEVKVGFEYTMAQKGIFNEIYEGLKAYTGVGILYQQETSVASEVSVIEDSMTSLANRLENKENRLWKTYTALETRLSELNSQSSWLSSQLANLA